MDTAESGNCRGALFIDNDDFYRLVSGCRLFHSVNQANRRML
jgi:hypothetical protein